MKRCFARHRRLVALFAALCAAGAATPCAALQLATVLAAPPSLRAPEGAAAVSDTDRNARTDFVAVDTDRSAITDFVRAHVGAPYQRGATGGQQGFDCSGLVLRAYAAAGVAVPRVTSQQLAHGSPVLPQALQAGDVLFYRLRASAPQQLHVAVYLGGGRAIHASVSHQVVREIDVTRPLWAERLVAARRFL